MLAVFGVISCCALAPAAAAQDYRPRTFFVDGVRGHDSAPGTSVRWPWRTISRVNLGTYRPGDRILFLGGQTHEGSLVLTAENASGTAEEPILVSSYGDSRATVASGARPGLLVRNAAGVRVADINFEGSAATASDGAGIHFTNDSRPAKAPIWVDHVEVRGYSVGVLIAAQLPGSYDGVWVTAVETHDNLVSGLTVAGTGTADPAAYALTTVYLGRVHAYHNRGDNVVAEGSRNASGSGIKVAGVDRGLIEWCVAHDNGGNNPAAGAEKAGGAFAISVAGRGIEVKANEAYRQRAHSSNRTDGGGFFLQATKSLFQYNYSHDNDGPGLLVAAFGGPPPAPESKDQEPGPRDGNYVRYNVSENDGLQTGEGSLRLIGALEGVSIFNNTIFARRPAETPAPVVAIEAGSNPALSGRGLHFYNNLFLAEGVGPLLRVKAPSRSADMQFEHNAYVDPAGLYRVEWGEEVFNDVLAWMAVARVEILGRAYVQPAGVLPVRNAGSGGVAYPESTAKLKAYRLIEGSPLIDAGVNLRGAHGARDFFGDPLPTPEAGKFDIGAHEFSRETAAALSATPSAR